MLREKKTGPGGRASGGSAACPGPRGAENEEERKMNKNEVKQKTAEYTSPYDFTKPLLWISRNLG